MITSILRLDVGGQLFASTLGTLTRDPQSKLAKLAYDKWLAIPSGASATISAIPAPTTPTIFIDRDPTHFRYVLNFLRDGDSVVLPTIATTSSESILRELLREAEFYELKSLQLKISSILTTGHSTASIACSCDDRQRDSSKIKNLNDNAKNPTTPIDWAPKIGDLVQWREEGFDEFWTSLLDKITHRGYVDWLFCRHCDNDYEVRLPELPDVLYGWHNVKAFLLDMKGKLDSPVNEKCVYVAWKNVYCGKDGYLDSVRFVMHIPLVWLKPFVCPSK